MTGDGRKRALVTGASGSLGTHFAKTLARAGMDVVLAARRVDALEPTVEEIKAIGAEAFAVEMDVTDSSSVTQAMDMIFKKLGELNVLVNNAGVATTSPLLAQSEEDWNRVIEVNLTVPGVSHRRLPSKWQLSEMVEASFMLLPFWVCE
jgi:NADP-dependent 3-hydroxy acid dehydrogenase YdfG